MPEASTITDSLDDEELVKRLIRQVEAIRAEAMKASKYRSTLHVLPTSVLCECLFSIGKIVMTSQRRHMDSTTFEIIMILKTNRWLFDAFTVDAILAQISEDQQDAKRQRKMIIMQVLKTTSSCGIKF